MATGAFIPCLGVKDGKTIIKGFTGFIRRKD
jgi:hypothetical protein